MLNSLTLKMNCSVGIFNAYSDNEIIHIRFNDNIISIPTLRQQSDSQVNLSLSDFVAPEKYNDYIGTFVVAIGEEYNKYLDLFKDDDYKSLLLQSLADRLAEATSEWLHKKVREDIWGYEAQNLSTSKRSEERRVGKEC